MSVLTGEPRGPIALSRPPLVGHRRGQTWTVDLLDMQDQEVGPLGKVRGGALDFSVHTEIRASGSLTVDDPGDVDWHAHRLAVRYEFTDEAGERHTYPLGVFLPTTPETEHTDEGASATVEMYDKTQMLSAGGAATTWTADAGTTVAAAVAEVLAQVGETRYEAPEDEGGTLKSAMTWEPGTPRLRVINDILAAGGFFSIWVDGRGVWQLTRYVEPARRGVEWVHESGAGAVFEAHIVHQADSFDVKNQVIIVGRSEQDEDGNDLPAPYAVAENTDPDDPFSIPRRGYPWTHREEDQDATSEAVLGQIAARRLIELSAVSSTYQVSHDYVPTDLNGAVHLLVPEAGIDARAVLQAWSWSWDVDDNEGPGMVASTLREVKT